MKGKNIFQTFTAQSQEFFDSSIIFYLSHLNISLKKNIYIYIFFFNEVFGVELSCEGSNGCH